MIKAFEVKGLNESMDFSLTLNPDLNIVTGKNGSGKTTLLKLMWYMLSSNLERTPEIPFAFAKLVTDRFTIEMKRTKQGRGELVHMKSRINGKTHKANSPSPTFGDPTSPVEMMNHRLLAVSGSSVFFPTFRRIEGGFSLQEKRGYRSPAYRPAFSLSEAIADYARSMSVRNHHFIASISTNDVEDLLTREYANVSDRTNRLHAELSQFISTTVASPVARKKKSTSAELKHAQETLKSIRTKTASVERKRDDLLRPFSVLSELIGNVFKEKGVQITDNLAFGHSIVAIPARSLSAGEKQMLSFLCYNAFSRDCVIFIDEPEISLHVDWQRVLVPTLLAQRTNNQFIIATHSPMIYSKFPQKELVLDVTKE